MPGLEDKIKTIIAEKGPVSVETFMGMAVTHYYATHDPFGAAGDFTTAPEISQMFGEMIGVWAADQWQKMEVPNKFLLIEAGPGRGTLMADLLRATKNVRGFHDAAQIVMTETSPALREKQKTALGAFRVRWAESIQDKSIQDCGCPVIFIANEFLDALPVRQFAFKGGAWHERMVGVDEKDALVFVPGDACMNGPGREGDIREVSPARENFVTQLCRIIKRNGGAALLIDYGYEGPGSGDTLQAVRKHKYTGVFEDVGTADLTAHVDFGVLRATVKQSGLDVGLEDQGAFLQRMGIGLRAEKLRVSATPQQRLDMDAALKRLTSSQEMGRLFKVMEIKSGGAD